MAKKRNGYLGLGRVISIILAILFGWVFGCIERFLRGKFLGAILALPFLLGFVFWIVDIITLIVSKDIVLLA